MPHDEIYDELDALRAQLAALERDHAAHLAAAVAAARLSERQACAALAETYVSYGGITATTARNIATAIRARGKGE